MFVTLKQWMKAWNKTAASSKRQKMLHVAALGAWRTWKNAW